jgi:metal-responsive CopG/Arc/MetJ family transcriptional regulator
MPTKQAISLKLSPQLLKEIDDATDVAGESRTAFLEQAAHRELERRRLRGDLGATDIEGE